MENNKLVKDNSLSLAGKILLVLSGIYVLVFIYYNYISNPFGLSYDFSVISVISLLISLVLKWFEYAGVGFYLCTKVEKRKEFLFYGAMFLPIIEAIINVLKNIEYYFSDANSIISLFLNFFQPIVFVVGGIAAMSFGYEKLRDKKIPLAIISCGLIVFSFLWSTVRMIFCILMHFSQVLTYTWESVGFNIIDLCYHAIVIAVFVSAIRSNKKSDSKTEPENQSKVAGQTSYQANAYRNSSTEVKSVSEKLREINEQLENGSITLEQYESSRKEIIDNL